MTHSTLGRKPIGWTVPLKRSTKLPHQKEDNNLSDFPWSGFGPFRWIFSMFSGPHLSCCLSLYQTQLFSLQPKQIESLITFHQPARDTTPDQYPSHHICHSPQWNTLPTHKTNHPGSTYMLFLPLTPGPVPSALPATHSPLTNQQWLCFGDEDDSRDI